MSILIGYVNHKETRIYKKSGRERSKDSPPRTREVATSHDRRHVAEPRPTADGQQA
ncbi:hypothetical protein [Moorella sp. Hama-1]|uniref:hypothetical protein n=1 Tax=Moorella sp. Hama-1 TaxID=2138101 RepID=UPI00137AFF55|nr:hypothetical protein [Moorella sp. Hama-1]